MEVALGEYMLNVDVKKNEEYYKDEKYTCEGCECDGCQNYELAVEGVSSDVSKLFNQFGIDIKKPAEVYVNYSYNNTLCYGGFYHICGEIIKGESPWKVVSEIEGESITSYLDENKMIFIGDNFKVAFQKECSLLSKSFPTQCIQMEILVYLPWVLQKENTY